MPGGVNGTGGGGCNGGINGVYSNLNYQMLNSTNSESSSANNARHTNGGGHGLFTDERSLSSTSSDGSTMSQQLPRQLSQIDQANVPNLLAQPEKPAHYSYLKEFRVEACPLFKQHQCTNHRPYSCFYWHFANQRRRKPIRRKDGTFNYSADVYCTKYDENTGQCPDSDECPYLHRVYGDVERKYHLRYYKTQPCVHPTDAKGYCQKNGAHCAFAHGLDDVRNSIFDVRELQPGGDLNGESIDHRERLNFVVEDQSWQDQEFVLINYKTEPCKKPPRLCRQGYACPFYHNGKDKRRPPSVGSVSPTPPTNGNGTTTVSSNSTAPPASTTPKSTEEKNGNTATPAGVKYRSTPCPNVKHGDEWGDPEVCEAGDECSYCHTRTEQQFHPEIYKSTKCNDMLLHGYCPRGPFCAFAHTDAELHGERRSSVSAAKRPSISGNAAGSFAAVVANLKHTKSLDNSNMNGGNGHGETSPTSAIANRRMSAVDEFVAPTLVVAPTRKVSTDQMSTTSGGSGGLPDVVGNINDIAGSGNVGSALSYSSVLKQRHGSGTMPATVMRSGSISSGSTLPGSTPPAAIEHAGRYSKAPGFEREQQSPTRAWPLAPGISMDTDRTSEASRIKSNLYLHHDIGCDILSSINVVGTPPTPGSMRSNSFSPFGGAGGFPNMWQQSRETVESVVGSIVEDMTLEEILPPISERDERGDSLPESFNPYTSSSGLYGTSAPVSIPGAIGNNFLVDTGYNTSGSGGYASPRASSYGGGILASSGDRHQFRMSGSFGQSTFVDQNAAGMGLSGSAGGSAHALNGTVLIELQKRNEELETTRNKLIIFEDNLNKCRQTCEAWKREAEKQNRRAQLVEQERDAIAAKLTALTNEFQKFQLSGLWPSNTDCMSQQQLEQYRSRLRAELDKVDRQTLQPANGPMCARCGRHVNGSGVPGSCPLCSPNSKNGQFAMVT